MKHIIIALCAVLLCSCGGDGSQTKEARTVLLTSPEVLDAAPAREFAATIREAHGVSLGFKTPGQIRRIHVKEGARVRSGQLLAELDDKDYKLGVEAAEIQYEQLRGEVARLTMLHDEKSISDNDFEKAKAGLAQLQLQLQANRNKLEYTKLYAPTDAVVAEVMYDESEMVDAGTPLFALLDVSHMEVEVEIPASEYLRHGEWAGFACTTAYTDGAEFPLQLLSVVPKADNSQLYRMRLAFAGAADSRLTAGMNAVVKARTAGQSGAAKYTLPLKAVFNDGGKACVWVLQADSTVAKRAVTLGGQHNGRAVIESGLDGSERVVRAGVNALQEGQSVKVAAERSETNVGGLL